MMFGVPSGDHHFEALFVDDTRVFPAKLFLTEGKCIVERLE
jgi:hypothetical protein